MGGMDEFVCPCLLLGFGYRFSTVPLTQKELFLNTAA